MLRPALNALGLVRRELTLVRQQGPALPFFATVFWLGLANRANLYRFTYLNEAAPFASTLRARTVWQHVGQELAFAIYASLPVWLIWRLGASRGSRDDTTKLGWPAELGLLCLLCLLGFIYGLQAHLVHMLNVPISPALLLEGYGTFPLADFVAQLSLIDHAYLWLPPAVFWLLLRLPPSAYRARDLSIATCVTACVLASLTLSDARRVAARARPLVVNPVLYGLDALRTAIINPPAQHFQGPDLWASAQSQRLRLSDPVFGSQTPLTLASTCRAGARKKPYNLVWVILESLSTRHAFNPERTGTLPMPTLHALRERGLFLSNHVSTSNSSPHSIFSMFSGLYSLPRPGTFSTTTDLTLPSLFSFLGPEYQSFIVSPGSLQWYFPYDFFKNTGVDKLWGRGTLRMKRAHPAKGGHLDERDATAFFLKQLKKAREPFSAVYYSFAPHYPYQVPDDFPKATAGKEPLDRYYDAMTLLDGQIARILAATYEKSAPEDTILILVGDHGEAFNQHKGNTQHGGASYMENFHTPALLVHPTLFPALTEQRYTSHVDILPTLLDAMCIPFEPALLQGQSLLQPERKRDYVFLYGSENAVTSIAADGYKLTADFRDGKTRGFDLRTDGLEKSELRVASSSPQLQATLQFQRFQSQILLRYQQSALAGEAFGGLVHPGLPKRATD